jgi:hypothetical protein
VWYVGVTHKINKMVVVTEIRPSANNEAYDVVVFANVLTPYQKATGKKPMMCSKGFERDKHTFTVDQEFTDVAVISIEHDEAQYEGHVAFEKTGKFYTTDIELL